MKRKRRTAQQREAICVANNWICHICGLPIDPVRQRWELDHPIPLANGGTDEDEALKPAHARCHLEKTVGDARVGPAADIELRDITCVAECTPTAVDAWEKAPWSR